MQTNPFDSWWFRAFLYAMFSAFGGTLGYVFRAMEGAKPLSWQRAVIEGIAAGFVGLIVLLVCQGIHIPQEWTGVIVGVSGWLGASSTIQMLEHYIFRRFGLFGQKEDVPNDGNNHVD